MGTEDDQPGLISASWYFFFLLWLFCGIVERTHTNGETGAETEAKACNNKRGRCDEALKRQDDDTETRPGEVVMGITQTYGRRALDDMIYGAMRDSKQEVSFLFWNS